MRRNTLTAWMIAVLLVLVAPAAVAAGGKPGKALAPGDLLPVLHIDPELSPMDRQYLGLRSGLWGFTGRARHTAQDIAAEIVLIEFLNIYCTSCQAQAPVMNALFSRIGQDPELQKTVRILGIAAGNNRREVERFTADKAVPFPVIPDADFAGYNAIGDPGGTPFTIVARKQQGALEVVSTHKGLIKDVEYLLGHVRSARSPAADTPAAPPADYATGDEDQVLEFPLEGESLRDAIRESMRAAYPGYALEGDLTALTLPSGTTVYRGLVSDGTTRKELFSRAISRRPVCDVCHGVHFITTFTREGMLVDFTPVHITKYGNVLWNDQDVAKTKKGLEGRNLKQELVFNPAVDAVSRATMSSALIYNSIANLRQVIEELEAYRE